MTTSPTIRKFIHNPAESREYTMLVGIFDDLGEMAQDEIIEYCRRLVDAHKARNLGWAGAFELAMKALCYFVVRSPGTNNMTIDMRPSEVIVALTAKETK